MVGFPANAKVLVGRIHSTFRVLELLVYDYDRLGVRTRVLPTGTSFQPWEPLPQWRGKRVPITLGNDSTAFDWGVTSDEGLFLQWDDYFEACGVEGPTGSVSPRSERTIDPFADLADINERLTRGASDRPASAKELTTRISRLLQLRDAYAVAEEMELGASGYDNTESMARYCAEKERLLGEAVEILRQCRQLASPTPPDSFPDVQGCRTSS